MKTNALRTMETVTTFATILSAAITALVELVMSYKAITVPATVSTGTKILISFVSRRPFLESSGNVSGPKSHFISYEVLHVQTLNSFRDVRETGPRSLTARFRQCEVTS